MDRCQQADRRGCPDVGDQCRPHQTAMSEKRNYALLAALLALISLFALAARSPGKAFALGGEILSFALPKESIQRKGNPGIVRKPGILANFEANARTRGSLPSNRSNMRIFKTSKQAKIPAHLTGPQRKATFVHTAYRIKKGILSLNHAFGSYTPPLTRAVEKW